MTFRLTSQDLSNEQTVSRQERTEEYQINKKSETVLLSQCGTKFEKRIDICPTLMARDYKGFGNQEKEAVIECQTEKEK